MLAVQLVEWGMLLAEGATPEPTPTFDPKDVTPGPGGFFAIFLITVLGILLIIDMARRVRKVGYRAQVQDEMEAESGAADPRPDEPLDPDDDAPRGPENPGSPPRSGA